jgi:hypothetical protein
MRGDRVLVCAIVLSSLAGGRTRTAEAQTAPVPAAPQVAAAACAPSHGVPPAALDGLRIVGAQDTAVRYLYGPNDLVIVNGGTQSGVQLNQEYFIRRPYTFGAPPRPGTAQSIHTAGRLRIVAANDATAIGRIQAICDGIIAGDYLEPFIAPAVVENGGPSTPATLDFSSMARVRFGDEERRLGAPGDFMLVDGADAPLTPGVRVAIYRDLQVEGLPLAAVGEGVIVSVENGIPLMRISSTKDAIQSGDYVIRHK